MTTTEPILRIAACSYEGSLFGWNVLENDSGSGLDLVMKYGFNCCPMSLRSVVVSQSGRFLACGGSDERVRLFNVVENRSLGEMSNQSGGITCLQFFGDSYLLAGSEDSNISIWRVHDCVCVHVLGGHKSAITSIAIHPSGKLVLSTSKDNTMKMWNLVHGRCAFTRRLKGPADKVEWHESGDYYLLVVGFTIQVFSASDNACLFEVAHKSRINQAIFTAVSSEDDTSIRVASVCENMSLYLHNLQGVQTAVSNLASLGGRPRDIHSHEISSIVKKSIANEDIKAALQDEGCLLTCATSTGVIAVFSVREIESNPEAASAQLVSTSVRIEPRFISVVSWNVSSGPRRDQADVVMCGDSAAVDVKEEIPTQQVAGVGSSKKSKKSKRQQQPSTEAVPEVELKAEDLVVEKPSKKMKKRKVIPTDL